MADLKSFEEVHQVLRGYMPELRSPLHAYTLERIRRLMDYLGNPQDSYKTIHVAGTSGKTSTCYYMAALLGGAGKKVGLTVSPHVDEINERVQIGLKPLPESKFCEEFSLFLDVVEKSHIKPTYFELLVAFAFWEFARDKVDYAVIEVGLGGLLDGTNVINRAGKVCVITDIGLDHVEVLGKTLPEIAAQKSGIIQPGNIIFSYVQEESVMSVLRGVSQQQEAELNEIVLPPAKQLPHNLPLFQRRNWYLAQCAYNFVAKRDKLSALNGQALAASTDVYVPARMEIVEYQGKTIIMDGAHNAQKLNALVDSIRDKYPKQSVAILASFVYTKQSNLRASLEQLLPLCNRLVTTSFDTPSAPKSSIDPLKIVEMCKTLGYKTYEIADSPEIALQKLLLRPEPILLITGSFYLLNHLRPLLSPNI